MTIVGTAGWTLPRAVQAAFEGDDGHLARYARVFDGVEINSSFHRPHRPATWARWAASVPTSFRFSVKVPRSITHDRLLVDAEAELHDFLDAVAPLGGKLGCLLVQLPPSLALVRADAAKLFAALRGRYAGPAAVEPRHASWFTPEADALLREHELARVAADPARTANAGEPGGDPRIGYWRLHGSPHVYRSAYDEGFLAALARRIHAWHLAYPEGQAWCIFDNTTLGAATANALALQARLRG